MTFQEQLDDIRIKAKLLFLAIVYIRYNKNDVDFTFYSYELILDTPEGSDYVVRVTGSRYNDQSISECVKIPKDNVDDLRNNLKTLLESFKNAGEKVLSYKGI
jgi:hypothetical protein